jgi:hypothetical protein
MSNQPKRKRKPKRLPDHIKQAWFTYGRNAFLGGLVLFMVLAMAGLPVLLLLGLWGGGTILAGLAGVQKLFRYTARHGNAFQQKQARAEFWGHAASIMSLVPLYLVIGSTTWLILQETGQLIQIYLGPVTLREMMVFGLSYFVATCAAFVFSYFATVYAAYNIRQAIYRAFDYDPDAQQRASYTRLSRMPEQTTPATTAHVNTDEMTPEEHQQWMEQLTQQTTRNG